MVSSEGETALAVGPREGPKRFNTNRGYFAKVLDCEVREGVLRIPVHLLVFLLYPNESTISS